MVELFRDPGSIWLSMKARLLVWLFLGGLVTPINAAPSLVPLPAKLVEKSGSFTLSSNTVIVQTGAGKTATFAAQELGRSTGFKFRQSRAGGSSINFVVDPKLSRLGTEGYRLVVDKEKVTVTASTEAGLFYGFQTFRQLLPAEIFATEPVKMAWTAPCVEIEDSPRFQWRGTMLDVCRHFMPKEDVKRFIDLMSMHKLNTFHWHLTDDQGWRIEIKKYPKLTEVGAWRRRTLVGRYPGGDPANFKYDDYKHGGFYTQDDVREIVAYAAERHITIVPEIEMPGHAQAAIAAYPWLGNTGEQLEVLPYWGVNPNVFNTSDRTIQFLKDVLDEVMDLFPGQFIHVGGDECPKDQWKTSAEAQQRIKDNNLKDEHELQSWFIKQFDTYLDAKGRRLIGWDEILEGGLAPGAAVMSWRGTEGGIAAAKSGHDVVMSPTSHCYLDYGQSRNTVTEPLTIGGYVPLSKVYDFNPVPEGFTADQAKRVLGAQGNLWTEYMRDAHKVDYMAFPRLCALAEVVWTPQRDRKYDEFMNRLPEHLRRLDQREVNYRALDKPSEAGEVIGSWKTGDAKNDWSERSWTIQEGVKGAGKYRVTFQYMSGGCRLDIEWVELRVNGEPVSREAHHGITGNFDQNNSYDLDLGDIPANAKVEIRARVRADGGDDSNGLIYLKKL